MVPLLTQLLSLPGVDVESYEETGNGLILSVERHAESARCSRCDTLSTQLHQNHGYLDPGLPISHYRQTWLKVNRRQFKCGECGKPFSESLDFIGGRRKYTDRYAEAIAPSLPLCDRLKDSSITSMANPGSSTEIRICRLRSSSPIPVPVTSRTKRLTQGS